MAVKIVTDSSADIPPQLLKELTSPSFPYVRFGNDVYRDKVDISDESFTKAGQR